jgi:septal ring factor EnvC (AmiA/AmiB activator)
MPDTVNLAAQKIWAIAWTEALNNIKAEREILWAAWRERELESCEMLNEIKRLETENEKQKDEIIELNNYLKERHSDIVELRRANKELEKENSELGQEV